MSIADRDVNGMRRGTAAGRVRDEYSTHQNFPDVENRHSAGCGASFASVQPTRPGIQERSGIMLAEELKRLAQLFDCGICKAAGRVASRTNRNISDVYRLAREGIPTAQGRGTMFAACQELEEEARLRRKVTGDALRKRRESIGLTKAAIARAIGVTHSAVCHWEWGDAEPSVANMKALAALLLDEQHTVATIDADDIRLTRTRRNWNYEEMAEAIGACPQSIANWESGKHTPRRKYALRILALMEDPDAQ